MQTTERGNTPSVSGMASSGESILAKASSNAHAAVNSMAGAADEAARKAKPAIDHVAGLAHQAVDKAANAAAPAADWLAGHGESLNVAHKKLVAGTAGYVSANPLKAIAIAVAAGFLLSRILH